MALTDRDRFLAEFPKALREETAAVFVGAGVSMGAGYPSWRDLLREIGEELGVSSDDVSDLAALAQWSVRKTSGYTRIRQVIRNEIAKELPIPESVEIIARLPVRHIWTTNYDRLIERAVAATGRPIDVVAAAADLSIRARPGASRLYKMHGSIERLDDLVIATDDYELFRQKRGAFLPLLQAHLTSMSMLFVGLSFADPNVRHVLSLIRESFTDAPPEHFAIVKPPQEDEYKSKVEFEARSTQHKLWAEDLLRYGLKAVEVDSYAEMPGLLREVERRVAQHRVWVSGSWPIGGLGDARASQIHAVAEKFGAAVGDLGLSLVSGAGLLVGSASMAGFLGSLQRSGSWDLERRLIVRPFPQPLGDSLPDRSQWKLLREELARVAGAVVFIGGAKEVDGKLVDADGVFQEFEVAEKRGAFLLPLGATGGSARKIAVSLVGSKLASSGPSRQRPTDEQLATLMDEELSPPELIETAVKILKSFVGLR